MGYYSIGITSVAATTGATLCTLHTGASNRAKITEIYVSCNAATASSIGLIRPANTPVATTSQLGQAENIDDPASGTNADTAWSTAPTISTNVYLRKFGLPATIGAGFIWTWPEHAPLVLNASSWLVLWNFSGSTDSALSVSFKWSE